MNTQRIEACFGAAKKLIFDEVKKDVRAPNVIALVFSDFDIQAFKVASYLKAVAGIHELMIVLNTYMEGLVRFTIINKVQETVYTSGFYPCSHDQYNILLNNQHKPEKIIFTFYHENEDGEGLLQLENEAPFFLYLYCYIQIHKYRQWKTG